MTPPLRGSIRQVAEALQLGEISAVELVQACLDRHDESLGAYLAVDAQRALEAARAADQSLQSEAPVPPLTGIPISVKDLYGVEGMQTFSGTTKALPADPWSTDSWLVAQLRANGAIVVGKTHMVEMAFGGVGMNPHWGTPRNPWDADVHRVPGGSSSGAGVSLLEGSALIALGSDTGGSIRIPAAMTGTVGQRTTRGRWPTTTVVPLSSTFDTVGALTRTVEDSAYFFGAVDPAEGDALGFLERLRSTELDGIRIAVPRCGIWDECQADIASVLRGSLDELGGAGAQIREVDGAMIDEAFQLALGTRPIAATECRAFLESQLPGWMDQLADIVKVRVENAPLPTDEIYLSALEDAERLATGAGALFADADVLALPANIITPPPVAEMEDMDAYGPANAAILRPTYPISVLGLTGISIPVGLDDAGMPVGLQLVAPGMQDDRLLAIAWAAERALGTSVERLGSPPLIAG